MPQDLDENTDCRLMWEVSVMGLTLPWWLWGVTGSMGVL